MVATVPWNNCGNVTSEILTNLESRDENSDYAELDNVLQNEFMFMKWRKTWRKDTNWANGWQETLWIHRLMVI